MDAVFKALNDPARRALLDMLRETDGQTLTQLEAQLDMSRFGVMKHLGVLEAADLVISRKVGRYKHHYLNVLPLQEMVDRWVEPLLAKPMARAVLDLKAHLEQETPMTDPKPDLIQTTYINCTHDALWDAVTRGDIVRRYHFATRHIDGDYVEGGTVVMRAPDGRAMLTQEVVSVTPKSRLETTFQVPDPSKPVSRCVYLVEAVNSAMKLTVEHYGLSPDHAQTTDGWARYLSAIKSYLEGAETRSFALYSQ